MLAVTKIATIKNETDAREGIFNIPKIKIENASAPTEKRIIESKFKFVVLTPKISSACQIDPQSAPRSELSLKNLNQPVGVVRINGRFIASQIIVVVNKYLINSLNLLLLIKISAIGRSRTIGKNLVAIEIPSRSALVRYFRASNK